MLSRRRNPQKFHFGGLLLLQEPSNLVRYLVRLIVSQTSYNIVNINFLKVSFWEAVLGVFFLKDPKFAHINGLPNVLHYEFQVSIVFSTKVSIRRRAFGSS